MKTTVNRRSLICCEALPFLKESIFLSDWLEIRLRWLFVVLFFLAVGFRFGFNRRCHVRSKGKGFGAITKITKFEGSINPFQI